VWASKAYVKPELFLEEEVSDDWEFPNPIALRTVVSAVSFALSIGISTPYVTSWAYPCEELEP
jgi:hypothetical protein